MSQDTQPRQVSIDYHRWIYLEGVANYFGQWLDSLEDGVLKARPPGDVGALLMAQSRLGRVRRDGVQNGDRIQATHEEHMRITTEEMFGPSAPTEKEGDER